MKIIRSVKGLSLNYNTAVTIGNFDGVHLAHQKIITKLTRVARLNKLKSLVVTFEPYPQAFFHNSEEFKISSFKEKYKLLESLKVDYLLILKFNENFSKITAHDFVKDILVNKLKAKYILIGDDFKFGHLRQGNFNLLKSQENKYGFKVADFQSVQLDSEDKEVRVSSTNIRNLLKSGDVKLGSKLLGRNFGVFGKVVKGQGLGRQIGFPTANIYIKDKKLIQLTGIFAVKVKINDNVVFGAASWGIRPTVNSTNKVSVLEVFLFDYSKDIYGKEIYVEFIDKIRDEKKFADLEELKFNISEDVNKAKTILSLEEKTEEAI